MIKHVAANSMHVFGYGFHNIKMIPSSLDKSNPNENI